MSRQNPGSKKPLPRIEIWPDIPDMVSFFETLPEYDNELYRHKKMKSSPESALTVLQEVLPVLEAQQVWTNEELFASLKAFIQEKGYKNGYVLWPVRIAVSGRSVTPAGATEILEILGKEESVARIKKGIEQLS